MRHVLLALALTLALPIGLAAAQSAEDKDLDLIPDEVLAPTADEPDERAARQIGNLSYKAFLEEAPQGNINRKSLVVPLPPGFQPSWQNRLSADFRGEWTFNPTWSVSLANRLNLLTEQGNGPASQWLNDFREGFATWRGEGENFADFGRVNVKSGVALGFNPTDFFRRNAVDIFVSADPSVLRDNRLGVLMARGQWVREYGALSLIAAPGVGFQNDAWWANAASYGLNLQNTNYNSKFLAKATLNLTKNLTPEILLYREGAQNAVGANLAYGIGDRWVVYGEYAGGQMRGLAAQAIISGKQLGDLPPTTPNIYPSGYGMSFKSQLAVGISYATEPKLSVNLEYHYNQQGWTANDLATWFRVGQQVSSIPGATGPLWWIRQFSRNQLQPLMQHQMFLRVAMDDVVVPNLTVSDVTFYSPADRSVSTQATIEYHVTPRVSMGVLLGANFGGPTSNFGSLPTSASAIGKFRVYF